MTFFLFLVIGWILVYSTPLLIQFYKIISGAVYALAGKLKNSDMLDNVYIDSKKFYVYLYGYIPNMSFIGNIDADNAFDYFRNGRAGKVKAIYQKNYFSWARERQEFSHTYFKIENKVLIQLGDDYVEILYPSDLFDYASQLVTELSKFKLPEKEEAFEINIITLNASGLDLKSVEIKPTILDLNLYYNDDFLPVDAVIRERLGRENDKGIILLHGLPGTGKTTYLRHLVGNLKKKVLFVSPSVAGNLMNPEFIDLLIDNPNAVLIIEDAENIIMDRKHNNNSSVSNLLNISDGLLSDCLNVQIICTFNSSLQLVDSALLRKGRLIATYEFKKLNREKAQVLSDQLGFTHMITVPMTLAEITNPDEAEVEIKSNTILGFRRETLMN